MGVAVGQGGIGEDATLWQRIDKLQHGHTADPSPGRSLGLCPHGFVVALAPLVAVILGSRFLFASAILVSVVVLADVVTGLVIPPWRHTPAVVGR